MSGWASALAHLQNREVDLLLPDLQMPEMTGFDVLKYLQQHRRGLPVILLSGMPVDQIELKMHGLPSQDGAIVDEQGNELGRHDGFWRFTPGQRRGLGVASAQPLYALRSDRPTNTVVVGPRTALARTTVTAAGRLYAPVTRVDAKLRYRSPAVGAHVEEDARGFRLELVEPVYAVAAGQAAVLYEEDAVVGAGLIRR